MAFNASSYALSWSLGISFLAYLGCYYHHRGNLLLLIYYKDALCSHSNWKMLYLLIEQMHVKMWVNRLLLVYVYCAQLLLECLTGMCFTSHFFDIGYFNVEMDLRRPMCFLTAWSAFFKIWKCKKISTDYNLLMK